MNKKWVLKQFDFLQAEKLSAQLNINKNLCGLLLQRNIDTFEIAETFFRPKLEQLLDPFLMKGMSLAVERIIKAITENEKIILYGDYDVDGTTAVAVVYNFLLNYTDKVFYYVPNRFKEGYGVSELGVNYIIQEQFTLVITLDCGIKSISQINLLSEHNIDTIICDHHLPDITLPNAFAILNPKQADCTYPFKELCGCGIGFKFITAIEATLDAKQELCFEYLDLVAAAIAADIVPMVSENRLLAFLGLNKANNNPCFAIQALKQSGNVNKEFTINDLVFIIAPRVNAAGRMDDARKAIDLFLSKNLEDATAFAQQLNLNNEDRRDADKQITEEAVSLMEQLPNHVKANILYQPHWHKGVVGIVASRIIEKKYKPTIILTESNGKISGSARSIPGLNLFEALSACSEYLDTFGGHYFAAGITLQHKNLDAFSDAFNNYVGEVLLEEDFIPKINIDVEITFKEITPNFYNILLQMEPYGPENMRPIFLTQMVRNYKNYSAIVKEKHIKFYIEQDGTIIKGIGFNLSDKFEIVQSNKPFNVVYTLDENEWNNSKSIIIKVIDILE